MMEIVLFAKHSETGLRLLDVRMHNESENESESDGASVLCTLCTFSAFIWEQALAKRYPVNPAFIIEPMTKETYHTLLNVPQAIRPECKRIEQTSNVPL